MWRDLDLSMKGLGQRMHLLREYVDSVPDWVGLHSDPTIPSIFSSITIPCLTIFPTIITKAKASVLPANTLRDLTILVGLSTATNNVPRWHTHPDSLCLFDRTSHLLLSKFWLLACRFEMRRGLSYSVHRGIELDSWYMQKGRHAFYDHSSNSNYLWRKLTEPSTNQDSILANSTGVVMLWINYRVLYWARRIRKIAPSQSIVRAELRWGLGHKKRFDS